MLIMIPFYMDPDEWLSFKELSADIVRDEKGLPSSTVEGPSRLIGWGHIKGLSSLLTTVFPVLAHNWFSLSMCWKKTESYWHLFHDQFVSHSLGIPRATVENVYMRTGLLRASMSPMVIWKCALRTDFVWGSLQPVYPYIISFEFHSLKP